MQGSPVKEDSPWILLKSSLMVNMIKFYTNGAGGSPSNERPSRCWLNFRYLNRLQAIRVELKWEFIYHVAFRCDNAQRVTLILESELK